jgi:catechol 2,3-dioxygenase-like lactoylglutathione lyase family enzyme
MPVPTLVGLRHVKVPVTDLPVALDWYARVLGFRPTREFADAGGVVRGVHGELPGIGDVLALREDPDAARGLGAFAVANFGVADRGALEAWVDHLDDLGVEHGPIGDTPQLSYLVFCNPDGQEIHLYAGEMSGRQAS